MNKMMSMMMMVFGVAFMAILLVVYSFSSMEISKIMYIVLWCGCIGIVRFAAAFGFGMER